MAGNGVWFRTSPRVLVKGDAREGEAIDDLTIRLQRQICAEDVPHRAIKDFAVLLVENRIQADHGCWSWGKKMYSGQVMGGRAELGLKADAM